MRPVINFDDLNKLQNQEAEPDYVVPEWLGIENRNDDLGTNTSQVNEDNDSS